MLISQLLEKIGAADIRYLTKKDLYQVITLLAELNGFNFNAVNYKVNSIELAKRVCHNLHLEYLDFKTTDLCGILYKSEKSTSIALNSRRSVGGRNFDCMHELMHYWLHDSEAFYCSDKLEPSPTSDYFEWQANEGAAQFLMPYQVFIPTYCRLKDSLSATCSETDKEIANRLCRRFNVGKKSIEIRIKGLEYEIDQFKNGIRIDELKILSLNKYR